MYRLDEGWIDTRKAYDKVVDIMPLLVEDLSLYKDQPTALQDVLRMVR